MVRVDTETGNVRPMHISDLHSLVSPVELGPEVPDEIRLQFDVARSAFVYSWFAFELVTLAEQQSYAVLEMALRLRAERKSLRKSSSGDLKTLLDNAVRRGWLRREDYEIPSPSLPGKTLSILDLMKRLRNNLAHGNVHLFPDGSLEMMKICAAIVSKLFPDKPERLESEAG